MRVLMIKVIRFRFTSSIEVDFFLVRRTGLWTCLPSLRPFFSILSLALLSLLFVWFFWVFIQATGNSVCCMWFAASSRKTDKDRFGLRGNE